MTCGSHKICDYLNLQDNSADIRIDYNEVLFSTIGNKIWSCKLKEQVIKYVHVIFITKDTTVPLF